MSMNNTTADGNEVGTFWANTETRGAEDSEATTMRALGWNNRVRGASGEWVYMRGLTNACRATLSLSFYCEGTEYVSCVETFDVIAREIAALYDNRMGPDREWVRGLREWLAYTTQH